MAWEGILNEEKRNLMKESDILNNDTGAQKIMESVITVESINYLSIERLKLLLTSLNSNERKLIILRNSSAIKGFNCMEIEKLTLLLNICINDCRLNDLIKLLENYENVNAVDFGKFELIYKVCLRGWRLLNLDNAGADAINEINMEKFKLLPNVDTVYVNGYEEIRLLTDRAFVDNINSFDIERFKLILAASYGDLLMSLLKNGNIINSMNIQRLSFLLDSYNIPRNCKIELLKNDEAVATINTIDLEKLKFYLNIERMTMEDEDMDVDVDIDVDEGSSESETSFHDYDDNDYEDDENDLALFMFYIHSMERCFQGRSYGSEYSDERSNLVNLPRSVHINCGDRDAHLIGQPSFANSLNLIEIRRFKLLSLKYEDIMIQILKNPNTTATVNSLDFNNLKTATKYMREHNLFLFLDTIQMDTRINFNLAMSLCRVGLIRNATYDYLLDNNALYAEIRKIFPKRIPIGQILVKSAINEGNVLNLKYLCLSFIIENFEESVKQIGVYNRKKSFYFLPNL